jgi:hypothetical protein
MPTIITGTAASETLVGTDGDDIIDGVGGNDIITASDGDDTIIFNPDLLTSNVDAGNGIDVLEVRGGSLPTGFSLEQADIERAFWYQDDVSNSEPWKTIVTRYSKEWVPADTFIVYDDLSRSDTYIDDENINPDYRQRREDYNSAGQLTFTYLIRDDGREVSTRFDPADDTSYRSLKYQYSPFGRVEIYDIVYDDGSRHLEEYNTDTSQDFLSIIRDYDTSNSLVLMVTTFNNNSRIILNFDPADANTSFQFKRSDYDANNELTYAYVLRDDGASSSTLYDTPDTQSYKALTTNYDTAARVVGYDIVYDSGIVLQRTIDSTDADPTFRVIDRKFDAFNRLIEVHTTFDDGGVELLLQDFNTANQLTYAFTRYADGSSLSTTYDVADQYSWNAYNYTYDAAGNVTDFFYT